MDAKASVGVCSPKVGWAEVRRMGLAVPYNYGVRAVMRRTNYAYYLV